MDKRLKETLRYAMPSIISMLVTSLYIVVDGIFIGNGVGENALAAVNIALPFTMASQAVSSMVTMGGSTICAIRLGRGDSEGAGNAFLTSASISAIFGILFTIVGAIFPRGIAQLSGASDVLLQDAADYIRCFSFFQVFMSLSMLTSSFVRIDGRPYLAFAGMIAGAVSNIFLDWLFVFPLGLGVKGAAIASGIGQILSLLILVTHFMRRKGELRVRKFKFTKDLAGKVFRRGIPEFVTGLGMPVTTLCYNYVIIGFLGEMGVAAYSVVSYIFSIMAAIFIGVSQGIQPLIGRSFGQKNKEDERYFYRTGIVMNLCFSVTAYLALAFGGRTIISLFGSDETMLGIATGALRIYGVSFIFASLNIMYVMLFQSTKQTMRASIVSVSRGLVLSTAFILLFPRLFGPASIWYAIIATEVVTLIIALWLKRGSDREYCLAALPAQNL